MSVFKRLTAGLLAALSLAVVAACGGGGDAGTSVFSAASSASSAASSGSTAVTAAPTISLALSSTTVTAASPATVTATVKTASGTAATGQVVTFTSTNGLGSFGVSTALTDAAGVATAVLYPATSSTVGADTVVASVDVNGTTITASTGFQLTATNVTISSFTSDLGSSSLAAYGQTTLTVKVAGAASGSAVNVSLGSSCVTASKATLTPTGSATTTTGTATFTYKDNGCGATLTSDSLTATVTGSTAAAALALPIATPAPSSITFATASPSTIYLKGSGLAESSTVTFKVVDISGNPLPNQGVTLEATTLAGGLTIDGGSTAVTKTSDSNGNVSVIVNSGTVPTPVRIKATLGTSTISTVSSSLSIAVGLPSELNFSLSQTTKNIEGMNIDGTSNSYRIIASDRLGNPVPAGTAINFITSGGQVAASRQITLDAGGNASASSSFLSAEPRPPNGRITVLAYALGEESFLDTNGDNVYTAGEAFQDLGNVYLDRAFDGVFDSAADQYISLSLTGSLACSNYSSSATYPLNLLALDASIPSGPTTCDGGWGKAYVRRATQTVLSTSTARPLWGTVKPGALDNNCAKQSIVSDNNGNAESYYLFGGVNGGLQGVAPSGSFSFVVADANDARLNPMAAGTQVSVSATTGLTVSVVGGSPVANTLSATAAAVSWTFATGYTSGVITVTFTSPSGVATSVPLSITQAAGTACTL